MWDILKEQKGQQKSTKQKLNYNEKKKRKERRLNVMLGSVNFCQHGKSAENGINIKLATPSSDALINYLN